MENKKATWSTSFFVFSYIAFYILITFVQSAIVILPKFVNIAMNADFNLPMDVFGWGLAAIICGYVGTNRVSMAIKTANMEVGTAEMGDLAKLRKMIYWTFVILIQNIVLSFFFNVNLPLIAVSSTFVSTITLYVAGNKAIRATQAVDTSGELWANEKETVIVDSNNDGIDDSTQTL